MKVFMSVDMEGIAGITDWDQCSRSKMDYGIGRELMTGEAAAAAQGALDAGSKEVVVGDSHGSMINILQEKMPRGSRLVQGRCKPLSMMQGISKDFDVAMFVGYHSRVGTQNGVLAHTYSGAIRELRINGKVLGEPGLNAMVAAHFGVPLVFLSGDEAACREARSLFPGIHTVATKKGLGLKTSNSIHPEDARIAIREGVKKALESGKPKKAKLPTSPFRMQVILAKPEMADLSEMIPGIKRKDSTTLMFRDEDFIAVYGAFLTIMRISGIAVQD